MKAATTLAAAAALAVPCSAIVAGSDAGPLDFPSVVSIQEVNFFGSKHLCGGAIIGPSTVLTAGSCCYQHASQSLKVLYGTKDLTTGGVTVGVKKSILHPSYSKSTRNNDYCILQTAAPFNLLVGPSAIALLSATPADNFAGLPLRVAGWGKKSGSTSQLPTKLQTATVEGIEKQKCDAEWRDLYPITQHMTCAEPLEREDQNISICNNDEGAPLMDEAGLTLVGVGSFFNEIQQCTSVPRANVFADVDSQRDWILQNTK